MNRVWGIALLVCLALIVGGFFLFTPKAKTPAVVSEASTEETPSEGTHTVILTKDGFVPDTLTIQKGNTVIFRTDTGELFWPASNLHPSHGIYPAFDPKKPVQPNASWSFTFDQVGEWKYHDHIAPYFTGVITVTE